MARCRYPTTKVIWLHECRNRRPTTNLESRRTPIHKLDGSLGPDARNSSLDIFWDNVTTVKKAERHSPRVRVRKDERRREKRTVFALLRVTFHLGYWWSTKIDTRRKVIYHLVALLEACKGHLSYRILLMGSLFCGQQGGISSEREMDTGEASKCVSDNKDHEIEWLTGQNWSDAH